MEDADCFLYHFLKEVSSKIQQYIWELTLSLSSTWEVPSRSLLIIPSHTKPGISVELQLWAHYWSGYPCGLSRRAIRPLKDLTLDTSRSCLEVTTYLFSGNWVSANLTLSMTLSTKHFVSSGHSCSEYNNAGEEEVSGCIMLGLGLGLCWNT